MAVGAFDQITNALKIAYPKKAIDPMVNEETTFRRKLSKNLPPGARMSDGIMKFGANLNPPQNVGQHTDGDNLPTPKDRTQDQFTMTATLFSGTFQIGWLTQQAANSNRSAFNGGELRRRTEETIADTAKFIEQTYVGTHGSSRRARVDSDGTSNFVCLKPEMALLIRENHYISVRTTDGGDTVRDSCDYRKVTAVNHDTYTVTYSSTDQTLVSGDHVSVVTKAAQTSLSSAGSTQNVSANGLRGLIDDATYASHIHLLSRTTYPKLKCNVAGNGGALRDLSEQILINACHQNRHRSGKRITDAWCNTGQVEKYVEFVAPDRRYLQQGAGITPMATGYQDDSLVHYAPGVKFNLNIAVDIIPREIFLLNWTTFFHYVAQDMDWWDEGAMLKPVPVSGGYKAAYFAALCSMENLGCDMPIGNTVVRDLNDPLCGD
jgi:hypothetical protein